MNDTETQDYAQSYLTALVKGDANKAAHTVKAALAHGISPSKVYLRIIIPSLMEAGEMWQNGKLSVAQENLATQITLGEMARIRQAIKPKAPLGLRAVVVTLDGESHILAGRIVADFLFMDGWTVDFLGSNTPASDLVKFISERKADLVAISVTVENSITATTNLVREIRKLSKPPKILIGGTAVKRMDESQITSVGADAVANSAEEAVKVARKICNLSDSQATMSQYLKGLGERILHRRKERNMTQQELAHTANLDRAYISSVEHGKQNMTIGAIYKLADALDVPLEELLVGPQS